MSVEVRVPTLGESVTEATVATWFKKPGDAVAIDEMLCELETDKVTVEVPSPAAGTLGEIVAKEGETVGVDALLATLTEGAGASPAAPPAKAEAPAAPAGSGGSVDVMVPALGESVSEATVASVFNTQIIASRAGTRCHFMVGFPCQIDDALFSGPFSAARSSTPMARRKKPSPCSAR